MNDDAEKMAEQAATFQKMWSEPLSRLVQGAFSGNPESAPPELLRQMRAGILQALSQSWEEFLRSPQFLEATKHWMDQAINFRKMSNEFLAKVRHETGGSSREDIDSVLAAVRHMEHRILDRVEAIAGEVEELREQVSRRKPSAATARTGPKKSKGPKPRSATARRKH